MQPLCGESHCEVAVVAVVVMTMAVPVVMMMVAMAVGRLAVRWRSLRRPAARQQPSEVSVARLPPLDQSAQ